MLGEILATGPVLLSQILTFLAVIATAFFWVWAYLKTGRRKLLELIWLPVLLWFLFGTLDIVITAKNIYGDPLREGNIAASFLFVNFGFFGPALASLLWISLWATVSLVFDNFSNKLPPLVRNLFQLTLFYSLFLGHFFGFHSWVSWGLGIESLGMAYQRAVYLPLISELYLSWALPGILLAALHLLTLHFIFRKVKPLKKFDAADDAL
ncbi:MAG: hypothetical protein NT157_01680 [Candidatus Micrarchaeota archaeon]|nr:hypothetical protein [Candidatus Micrarchaeota archaeon]